MRRISGRWRCLGRKVVFRKGVAETNRLLTGYGHKLFYIAWCAAVGYSKKKADACGKYPSQHHSGDAKALSQQLADPMVHTHRSCSIWKISNHITFHCGQLLHSLRTVCEELSLSCDWNERRKTVLEAPEMWYLLTLSASLSGWSDQLRWFHSGSFEIYLWFFCGDSYHITYIWSLG